MELALQTMASFQATLEVARWAEQEGVSCLAVADHYLSGPGDRSAPALDQLTVLAGIARETSRIALASLVSPITFRHPAVMLKTAVTMDEMSGGRFSLGVGTGWMVEEHEAFGLEFPEMEERFRRLEEALGYLRAATSGEGVGFEGDHYRLERFDPRPRPSRLRLVVGGAGAHRTPRLAGTYADEYNVFPARTPVGERVERARSAAEAAGRHPDRLLMSFACPPLIGEDEAEVGRRLEAMSADQRIEAAELARRWEAVAIPFGTVDRVAEGLALLAASGVERLYLQVSSAPLAEIVRAVGLYRKAIDAE